MWHSLHDAWWRVATTNHPRTVSATLLGSLLQGGAVLYRLGVELRNTAYDRGWFPAARLPCPVISVGNLTVGGTGKTSCVELLTNKLRGMGKRVTVLSRGYGGRLRRPYWVMGQGGEVLINGQEAASRDGLADEPHMLALHLPEVPIVVGPRREQTGQQAMEQFQAQVLILDDGFQHRQLQRDCEVVLVSARMPLGGWPLLPRGPMREPLTALARASVIVLTKFEESLDRLAALQERVRAFNPEALIASAIHEPVALMDGVTGQELALDHLMNRRVFLLSSIGDPEGFEQTVRGLGAATVAHRAYPDHYRYAPHEWQAIRQAVSASGAEALVTTEKDVIRLRHPNLLLLEAGRVPIWVLGVRLRLLNGEEALDDRLARVCAG